MRYFDPIYEMKWWKPGYVWEVDRTGDRSTMATAMGKRLIEVIHVCELPGRYQRRVFYKRKWVTPENRKLGSDGLLVHTQQKFMKVIQPLIPDNWDNDFKVEYREE